MWPTLRGAAPTFCGFALVVPADGTALSLSTDGGWGGLGSADCAFRGWDLFPAGASGLEDSALLHLATHTHSGLRVIRIIKKKKKRFTNVAGELIS